MDHPLAVYHLWSLASSRPSRHHESRALAILPMKLQERFVHSVHHQANDNMEVGIVQIFVWTQTNSNAKNMHTWMQAIETKV